LTDQPLVMMKLVSSSKPLVRTFGIEFSWV
jgi:hypothetical protein